MPFQYTFRSDDISTWDVDTRDLLENRDRELELYSTTIDTSFLNLNASNLTSGTVPSARMTGAYTGITSVGTLGSLTVTGDLTVDTNTLRVDSTNNRVGINVTSPTSNLDVVGNQVIRAAATQDGIQLAGRAGGTSSYKVTLTPTTLTADRTLTLPNTAGTLITTGNLSSITSVGTLETLNIGGAGQNRWLTINAPTGYYAIQYFAINGVFKWHYEVNPAGDRWSLVQTGVAERIGVTSTGATFSGTITLSSSTNAALTYANTPDTALPWSQGPVLQGQTGWAFYSAVLGSYRMGFRSGSSGVTRYMWSADACLIGAQPSDTEVTKTFNVLGSSRFKDTSSLEMTIAGWSGDNQYSAIQTSRGYLLLGRASADDGIFLRSSGAGSIHIGASGQNALIVGSSSIIVSGNYTGGISYGSYGSVSMGGATGGWAGISFPDTTSAMMLQNTYFGHYRNNTTWNFYVNNGTYVPSDERYKRDIQPLQNGLNFIREIIPVTYDPLTESLDDDPETTVGKTHYGFTTQNILQALSNAGETRDVAVVDIGGPSTEGTNSDRQYLNHSALLAPMVKAIQELDARLQQLETV